MNVQACPHNTRFPMDRATEEDCEVDADRSDGLRVGSWVDGTVDEASNCSASPCTDDGRAKYCGVKILLYVATKQ